MIDKKTIKEKLGVFNQKAEEVLSKIPTPKKSKVKTKSEVEILLSQKEIRSKARSFVKKLGNTKGAEKLTEVLGSVGLLPTIKTGKYKGNPRKIRTSDLKKAGIIKKKETEKPHTTYQMKK